MSNLYYDAGPSAFGQKVCLATTAYDSPDSSYTFSIQKSREALAEEGIESAYLLLSGNCHVDDARNSVIAEFLTTDCTDLVFLDADVSWNEEDLVTLCQYDHDVVGGVYPYRRDGMQDAMPVRPLLSDEVVAGDGLIEVEGVPTGFLRIRRVVLERLAEAVPHFHKQGGSRTEDPLIFERTLEDGIRWGGDLVFCNKWRAMGGKVFAATEMRLGHTGKKTEYDSLAACLRRGHGLTLGHVAHALRDGSETENHFLEVADYVKNLWSVPPFVMAAVAILARAANGPIIETGSGVSTIIMAAANPDQTVFCLEHDPLWAMQLERWAYEAGVKNIALCQTNIVDGWYDLEPFPDLPKRFALGLNDGPPRALGNRMGFFDHFSCDVIVADDADTYAAEIEAWCAANERPVTFETRLAIIRPREREKLYAVV